MWKGDKQRRRELGRMKGKGLLVKAVSGGGDRLSSYRAPGPSVTDRSQNLHSIKARETKARRGEGLSEPRASVTSQASVPRAWGVLCRAGPCCYELGAHTRKHGGAHKHVC